MLRADIHAPATPSGEPARGPFPVILGLTPYGKEEARAAAEVVGWAAGLPRSTGKAGMLGESYLTFVRQGWLDLPVVR